MPSAWHGPPNFVIQDLKGPHGALLEVFPGLPEYKDGYVYANDKPGLGYSMAEGLMEAGCEVAVVGTTEKVQEVAKSFCDRGFACHGVQADFSKREGVYQGFRDCVEKLGGDLDILVTSHGIQRRHSAEVFPIEEWDEVLNVNLNSVFILCQEAGKIMLENTLI